MAALAQTNNDDDEIPQYSPLITALAGTRPDPTDPSRQTSIPVQQPAPPLGQPVQAAPQSTQPPQSSQDGPTSLPPSYGFPLPPKPYEPDQAQHLAYEKQLEKDSAKVTVAPKWWERLAGAGVGFGVGYKEGPTAGIRAGSAVTNRGQDAEEADRTARLAADNTAMDLLNRKDAEGYRGYEAAQQNFGNQMSVVSARDRETQQKQEKDDRDRNYNRDITNDKRAQDNTDNTLDYEQQVHKDALAHENAALGETVRHNRVNESLDSAKDKRETSAAGALTLRRGTDANNLGDKRKKALAALDNGDESKGTLGFNARLKALQTAKTNPENGGAPYTAEQREKAINDLQEAHTEAKNQIESEHAEALRNLGFPAVPVRYAADGVTPLNNSDGSDPGQQQRPALRPAGAAGAAPPAAQPAPQPVAPVIQRPAGSPNQQPNGAQPSRTSSKVVSVAEALRLPQYKGKSAEEVTAAIKAHGYEVRP